MSETGMFLTSMNPVRWSFMPAPWRDRQPRVEFVGSIQWTNRLVAGSGRDRAVGLKPAACGDRQDTASPKAGGKLVIWAGKSDDD